MTRHVKTNPREKGKIGKYADKREYFHEINYVMKMHDVPIHRVDILEETVDGSEWIMIDNHWHGDLDDHFYECMDQNAPKSVYFMRDHEIRKWRGE